MAEQAHKLAKAIQLSSESDEFDLKGYDEAQVIGLVNTAFKDPIKVPAMVRFTFVIGGGKNVRGKYSPELAKWMRAALSDIGFADDRGASCDLACQGSYKYQHDTDKDLIFMHVFPNVEVIGAGGGGGGGGGEEGEEEDDGEGGGLTHEELVTVVSLADFRDIVRKKVKSLSQRKVLLKVIKGVAAKLDACDGVLTRMEALSDEQQHLYDSAVEVHEKIEWLTASLEEMVEEGQLTSKEKSAMLDQLASKIEAVTLEVNKARESGNEKKAAKLESASAAMMEKHGQVCDISPITHAFKHQKELDDLKKRLKSLLKIENSRQLQDPKELKKLRDKDAVVERIADLERKKEGWFMPEGEEAPPPPPQAADVPEPKKAAPRPAAVFTEVRRGGAKKAGGGGAKKASGPANAFALLGGGDDGGDDDEEEEEDLFWGEAPDAAAAPARGGGGGGGDDGGWSTVPNTSGKGKGRR